MTLTKTYQLPFSLKHVYTAWVSSTTVIAPATSMDIKPVAGGHYTLIIDTPEFKTRNNGIFNRVEYMQRLVYSWQWLQSPEKTEIDVRFSAANNGTQIILIHSGFLDTDSQAMHDSGWDSYISGLHQYLAEHPL